jgi:hypothetical protein
MLRFVSRTATGSADRASVPLEILDVAFVLLRLLKRVEGTQVAALAGRRILLTRIQAELTGFEFSYHGDTNQRKRKPT